MFVPQRLEQQIAKHACVSDVVVRSKIKKTRVSSSYMNLDQMLKITLFFQILNGFLEPWALVAQLLEP